MSRREGDKVFLLFNSSTCQQLINRINLQTLVGRKRSFCVSFVLSFNQTMREWNERLRVFIKQEKVCLIKLESKFFDHFDEWPKRSHEWRKQTHTHTHFTLSLAGFCLFGDLSKHKLRNYHQQECNRTACLCLLMLWKQRKLVDANPAKKETLFQCCQTLQPPPPLLPADHSTSRQRRAVYA